MKEGEILGSHQIEATPKNPRVMLDGKWQKLVPFPLPEGRYVAINGKLWGVFEEVKND